MNSDNKRYNLAIPQEKWDEVCMVAERVGLPVAAVLRRYIDLRLTATELQSVKPRATATENTATFRIRILEEPLTPYNLASTISAITELSTKCWLIVNKRFADLVEYTQTHDVRFVEETPLIITKITYNSPFDASFKIDLSASDLAIAIGTAIDGVTQAKKRLEKAELENKAKVQEIEHAKQKAERESKAALLEQEQQELAIERERLAILEKRLDVQKKGIEYALEIATKASLIRAWGTSTCCHLLRVKQGKREINISTLSVLECPHPLGRRLEIVLAE